jgi:hemoglobin/transferrin/lactoferrin receptor protein
MKLFLIVVILLTAQSITAQDSIRKAEMEEIIVSAYRFPENIKNVPFSTKKISNKGWNMQTQSMAEVLSNSGSVFVQKSQAGGGSPIVRGFEASRVLLMVDGVRMNNAIYRSGHLQNAITVDPNILNNVDIIYGPASTQYGSDALGGVVAMFSKKPVLSLTNKTLLTGNVGSRFSSAMNELQLHGDINISNKKWASLTSITLSDFGDVVQGDKRNSSYPDFGKKTFYINTVSGTDFAVPNNNVNKQLNSAYKQIDFLQKIRFVPKEGQEHLLNLQYSSTNDVPRYDRLTEVASGLPRFGEWYYGPQKRALVSYTYNKDIKNGYFSKLQSVISYQNIEESRFDRRFNNKNKNNRIETVDVVAYTLDGLHKKGNNESHIGIDLQFNKVKSVAYSENIVTGIRQNNINTRYPDGKNNMNFMAAYYQNITKLKSNLILNAGVRLTQANLNSNFVDKSVTQFPFDNVKQKHTALSGNLGLVYNSKTNWKLASVLSTGFRAPNVDDLGKVFDSKAGAIVVPNPSLKPEYTYNAELNATKFSGASQFGASVFYTLFRNAIVVDAFTYNGQSTVTYQGVPSQVLASQNKAKAFLYGASAFAQISIAAKTIVDATGTYTYGRVKGVPETPLDHIPPFYGKVGIKHNEQKWNAEVFSLFNGWKRIKDYSTSGEDNQQYASVDGMPSWFTLNFRSQLNLHTKLHLLLGVENILDTNYRVFASGISAPGRNFIIGLKAAF